MATVQRKIAEVLARDVDDALRLDELCREIYGEANVRKKHRVSVIRAGKWLLKTRANLGCIGSSGFGLVFFNQGSVMSYARARLKASGYYDDRIRSDLAPGGYEYGKIAEGGAWWLRVQLWIANAKAQRR